MKKTILIVDDKHVNRRILKKLLCEQYDILEAENGQVALNVLKEQKVRIAAVLLDLVMPVMDGYAVLKAMLQEETLSEIPVIVVSETEKPEAEKMVLQLGARDFIAKPYNPIVLHKRVANLIELYESNVCLLHSEKDELTGLYNSGAFCRRAAMLLDENPAKRYTLIVTDVERFKLVNDSFGTEAGDKLLRYIAAQLKQSVRQWGGVCGRISADHFALLLPYDMQEAEIRILVKKSEQALANYPLDMKISLKFGVYPIDEREVPVSLMCDRAMLAAETLKGHYHCVYAFYDDSIRQRMLREQEITDAMNGALAKGQFVVYLQPKYDLQSEQIAGAEALVRWTHPELGLMNPADFVPLFERNGFITELDRYIWDKSCEIMQNWITVHKKYVPVSVNVSRKDIYQIDLPEILMEIVKKHDLRPNQLHLEITETAYTENPDQLIEVVGKLKELGFVIEMDDFGSGYSSLNMLSELPIDILKLDMRFIQKETSKNSSRNILSFIISLAKWMNLLVTAEGVETQEQLDLLRNMDCNYVQGYYYAKPIPAAEFTKMLLAAKLAPPIASDERDWQEGALRVGEKTGEEIMLIVDDIPLNREILAEYFRNIYTIVEADNGQVAYQYIEQHSDEIAVIMLDLVMPVMDGFQLLKLLRQDPLYAAIPVVVTSQAGEISEAHAFELGASDFLPKPYNMDIALHRVQNVTAHSAVQTLEREKRMLSKMKKLALDAKLDQMTGVYNRMEMERQVREFFAAGTQQEACFFMLDIDNFKSINDLYGHTRGDEALIQVAERLQALFREDDLVCRMGGDEFAVFMRTKLDNNQLMRRLGQMCDRLSFQIEQIAVSCSIGACVSPQYGTNYEEVYHNADVALLTAKRLGKNRWNIYGGEELPSQILYRNMDWLLDESSDAIIVCDAETYAIYYANDEACALAGKKKDQCLGKPCYQAIWGHSAPCSHCVHISKLTHEYCEHEFFDDATENSYIIKGKLIDWGSRPARIQYVQNNTRRAQLSRQLSELSEDRRMLLDLVPGGLLRYNAQTQQFNFISENMLQLLGYSRQEFERKFENRFDCMVFADDRARVLAEIDAQIKVAAFDTCEYRIEKKDGTLCWVHDEGHFRADANGGEFYVIVLDITAQKLAEQKNQELAQQLEDMVQNVPGALCLYHWDGKHLHTLKTSRQFAEIVGIENSVAQDNIKYLKGEFVCSEDWPGLHAALQHMLQVGGGTDYTFRVFHNLKKEYVWMRMQITAKRQADGEMMLYALYTDVTEQQRLSALLRAQNGHAAGQQG